MYLEIDEGFPGHRKTLRLCSLMNDPKAGWHMVWLWTWACRSCKDGNLRGLGAFEIEDASRYHAHDGKLCAAMIDAGFLDKDSTGNPIGIHNWMKRTGAAIAKMDAEADRKRAYRAHRDGKCGPSCQWCEQDRCLSADSPRTVQRTSSGQTDTDQSSQDQSSQDQSSQDKTRPEKQERASKPARTSSEAFSKFWQAYPRKTGKGQAIKAWPGDELLESILAALAWQVPTWRDPQFIKHPATWLRARCWEDERQAVRAPTSVLPPNRFEIVRAMERQRIGDDRRQPTLGLLEEVNNGNR